MKSRGIGICINLTIILAVLKLIGVIGWSWWVVSVPLIFAITTTAILFLLYGIILVTDWVERR